MTIDTLLFDADGVVQRARTSWRDGFAPLLAGSGERALDQFTAAIEEAESECLESLDFAERLTDVLKKWRLEGSLEEVLKVLNGIVVYPDVIELVRALRQSGVSCHLASNQQSLRAEHMSAVLNYREIFEQEFYSCHLGIAKPKPEFFEEITIRLGQPAASILFVDDRMENVLAARKVGLRAEVYDAATGAPILYEILHSHDLFGSAEIPQPPSLRSTSAEAHSPSDQPR